MNPLNLQTIWNENIFSLHKMFFSADIIIDGKHDTPVTVSHHDTGFWLHRKCEMWNLFSICVPNNYSWRLESFLVI